MSVDLKTCRVEAQLVFIAADVVHDHPDVLLGAIVCFRLADDGGRGWTTVAGVLVVVELRDYVIGFGFLLRWGFVEGGMGGIGV